MFYKKYRTRNNECIMKDNINEQYQNITMDIEVNDNERKN